jgi:hypothetical protein
MKIKSGWQASFAAMCVLGCGMAYASGSNDHGTTSPEDRVLACAELAKSGTGSWAPNPSTVIDSAKVIAALAATSTVITQPAHCEVFGSINKRVSEVDGQTYAIKFHMRLPISDWNGRFFQAGGGGTNGNLGTGLGELPGASSATALARGFASISTDGGHDNVTNNRAGSGGSAAFGLDPQARVDQFRNSYDQVTQTGKALVNRFYGKAPEKSYFFGCSEGGREAFQMSQKFPTYFDGIIAGAPAFNLPRSTLGGVNVTQKFANLARRAGLFDAKGGPLLGRTYTDADVTLISEAVLAACDDLDGVKDQMVLNAPACTGQLIAPKLDALVCTGEKTATCLTADQIATIKQAAEPTRNAGGLILYNAYPLDPGFGGVANGAANQGWRAWWLGAASAATNSSNRIALSSGSLFMLYVTPPHPFSPDQRDDLYFGFDYLGRDPNPAVNYPASGIYSESPGTAMSADSTDLSAFKARGGKLLVYHGTGDAAFTYLDTADWYTRMNAAMNQTAPDFARYFPVPGMNHCVGGPSTDQFDLLQATVDWVENGVAPARIEAKASNPAYFGVAMRSRPLCPYPQTAHYTGSGDINIAASFVCQ